MRFFLLFQDLSHSFIITSKLIYALLNLLCHMLYMLIMCDLNLLAYTLICLSCVILIYFAIYALLYYYHVPSSLTYFVNKLSNMFYHMLS